MSHTVNTLVPKAIKYNIYNSYILFKLVVVLCWFAVCFIIYMFLTDLKNIYIRF